LQALGHIVRLIPPAYVKPYVKRQKNDAADAEAICEAVTRANMRFVPTKTPEQQSGLVLHRTRHLFIRQQTAVINAIRAHLAEFGIVAPVGRHGVEELLDVVADPNDERVPEIARACLSALGAQLRRIKEQILEFDRMIRTWHRSNEMSMRLDEAPGIGPVLATAVVATVADPKSFRSGRNFSAWIGIVPKQHSSGGKNRLGNISKRPLSARPVRGRRARRYPLCQDPWHQTSALAHGLAGAAADQGCCYRAGEQDCANGLGHDGQGRAIQGTRRACGVNEIAPDNRRDVKVGRANST
jgi:transposase